MGVLKHRVPFIAGCNHLTRKKQGFVLPLPPKHKPHATFMQPLQCVSPQNVANLHISTHVATSDDNNQPAIPLSATTDSRHAENYAHRNNHSLQNTEEEPIASGTTPAAPAAHTRYLSSPAAATLHGKTQGFLLRLPPQNKAHATFMQPFHCGLQPEIPKHPITTHTQAQPKQLEATVTMRQNKKGKPTAAAPAAHRRYLSSPPAATLRGKIQGFVPRLPPQNKAHATFMQPLQCVLQHPVANLHLSTHMATPDDNNHAGQFFCDVVLCSVKSHTALHQGQFFCDVLLCDVKSHTALHQGQFFCDVLLCDVKSHTALHQGQFFCDVLLCDVKSHTALHQGQFFCDVLLCDVKSHTALHQGQFHCDVLLCDVKSHTTLHQGQFHQLKVIRNSEVLLPNII